MRPQHGANAAPLTRDPFSHACADTSATEREIKTSDLDGKMDPGSAQQRARIDLANAGAPCRVLQRARGTPVLGLSPSPSVIFLQILRDNSRIRLADGRAERLHHFGFWRPRRPKRREQGTASSSEHSQGSGKRHNCAQPSSRLRALAPQEPHTLMIVLDLIGCSPAGQSGRGAVALSISMALTA